MVSLLQIAMACVASSPEKRPEMAEVLEMIEGIRHGESVMDSESFQSQSISSDGETPSLEPRSILRKDEDLASVQEPQEPT